MIRIVNFFLLITLIIQGFVYAKSWSRDEIIELSSSKLKLPDSMSESEKNHYIDKLGIAEIAARGCPDSIDSTCDSLNKDFENIIRSTPSLSGNIKMDRLKLEIHFRESASTIKLSEYMSMPDESTQHVIMAQVEQLLERTKSQLASLEGLGDQEEELKSQQKKYLLYAKKRMLDPFKIWYKEPLTNDEMREAEQSISKRIELEKNALITFARDNKKNDDTISKTTEFERLVDNFFRYSAVFARERSIPPVMLEYSLEDLSPGYTKVYKAHEALFLEEIKKEKEIEMKKRDLNQVVRAVKNINIDKFIIQQIETFDDDSSIQNSLPDQLSEVKTSPKQEKEINVVESQSTTDAEYPLNPPKNKSGRVNKSLAIPVVALIVVSVLVSSMIMNRKKRQIQ